jgi:translocation and assembly module TamB
MYRRTTGMEMSEKVKRGLRKTLKIFGYVIGSILLLLVLAILLIQLPAVQQKITQKAITFLEKKIGTEVRLEKLYISFPKNIVIKGLYMEDQKRDTLLFAGRLSVNTDLFALLKNEVELNNITLENTTAYVKRADGDSTFNFSYIVEAFVDTTQVDTTKSKWTIDLDELELEKIKAHYHDNLTGNKLDVNLGEFQVTMDEFDLERSTYKIDEVNLGNTRIDIVQTKYVEPELENDTTQALALALDLNEAAFENVQANFRQEATGQQINIDLDESYLKANDIDFNNKVIDLETFELKNSRVNYIQLKGKKQQQVEETQPVAGNEKPNDKNWRMSLAELDLAGNTIQYYDYNKPYTKGSFDFDRVFITALTIGAEDISINGSDIRVALDNFSFREQSGFQVTSMRGTVAIRDDSASLRDFILITRNSKLQMTANSAFQSFATISKNYPTATVHANIQESYVGLRDILYFNPHLKDSLPLKLSGESRIYADALFSGSVNNLNINHLDLKAFDDTYLKSHGHVVGLPNVDRLALNVSVDKFYTTEKDIRTILPDTVIPESISLPNWINLAGEYRGKVKAAEFKTILTSSLGSADLTGKMDLDSTSSTRGFEGKLAVNDFRLGTLLKQSALGNITLHAAVKSDGLTKEEMTSAIKATIDSIVYQGYEYKNFELSGTVKNDVFKGWASLKDKNLDFAFDGDVNFQTDVPHYDFTFDLRNANFQKLGLAERPLRARGTLEVDMATADMKVLNGTFGIRKVAIFNGDALYAVDSLLFASVDQEGRSEIKIDSDVLDGKFEGTINIFTMPAVIREYVNTYYSLHDSVEQSYEAPQRFNFDLKLKKTELLTDIIIPELESFEPGEINGVFDSKRKQLDLRFDITKIQYGKIGLNSFLFTTHSDSTRLNYDLFADEITIDSMRIDGLEFKGRVAHDSIQTSLVVLDSVDLYKYLIGGTFYSRQNDFEFKLDPNQIKLYYDKWAVPADNYIRFGGPKIVAHNIEITNERQRIIFESKHDPRTPIYLGFRELNLEYLLSLIAQEKPVSGLLHGDINLYPEKDNFRFTSSVAIQDFGIAQVPWGDISLSVNQNIPNKFDVNFRLMGNDNNIRSTGYYTAGENPTMHLTTTIGQFNLAAIAPLAVKHVTELKGILSGQVIVAGSTNKPSVDGAVWLKNTHLHSTYLGTGFLIREEKISFTREGISFDEFVLADERKNTARINGAILTSDYKGFRFKLDVLAEDFRMLSTTAKDNNLFYGKVDANANMRIRGTMSNPSIDMELSLGDGSNLTYVVPQTEASVMEAQGIVKFVDKTFKGDPFIQSIQPDLVDTIKTEYKGIDLSAKIELDDKETFTVIIDPTTEDQLTVKGNTTLTLQIDRTGDIRLAGRYEITEGTYNLSFYKFLKREFKIQRGSVMTWSGDPLNAAMEIEAMYEVETAPIDLLANQLTNADPREANQYKQRLPFQVLLKIGGQLLKPDISFALEMPMEERNVFGGNVYARIQDINTRESDLNKQVFALLILKRFISDNPFESQGAAGFEGTARSSVSKMLTEQLNRLSENIRGVELSFDVKSYEDYSSGSGEGQTELQLGVSKNLFNDRLVVKLTGNVDIEGENTNRDPTDYIGDIALEYKMTEDGRFRITGFRNSNYDMIDGELTETGAGLIYIKDYNTLAELFKANAKKK